MIRLAPARSSRAKQPPLLAAHGSGRSSANELTFTRADTSLRGPPQNPQSSIHRKVAVFRVFGRPIAPLVLLFETSQYLRDLQTPPFSFVCVCWCSLLTDYVFPFYLDFVLAPKSTIPSALPAPRAAGSNGPRFNFSFRSTRRARTLRRPPLRRSWLRKGLGRIVAAVL